MGGNQSEVERLLRKQTALLQAQVVLRVVILLVIAAAGIFFVREAKLLNHCLTLAEEKLEAVDADALNAAVKAVGETAEGLRSIDTDTINHASDAIQSAADSIRGLDLEKLDAVIQGLDSAAGKLDSAVKAFKNIFN